MEQFGNKIYYTERDFADKEVYINDVRSRGMVVEKIDNVIKINSYGHKTKEHEKEPTYRRAFWSGLGVGATLAPLAFFTGILVKEGIEGLEGIATDVYEHMVGAEVQTENFSNPVNYSRGPFTRVYDHADFDTKFGYTVVRGDTAWKIEEAFEDTYRECHTSKLSSAQGEKLADHIEPGDYVQISGSCLFP